ncbi:MAG: hypothetical protein IPN47_20455 [Gemmatimonadetes bacterium]|nr:hypothetical protein [Gemmatimonadota bacterium]
MQALAAWYADRTQRDGWSGERVVPMLAGMAELVPWLRQWHNELDAEFGDRPGEAYATWLSEELHAQGLTAAALDAWEPPRVARAARKGSTTKRAKRSTTADTQGDDDAAEPAE